jgi:hypothetical protein
VSDCEIDLRPMRPDWRGDLERSGFSARVITALRHINAALKLVAAAFAKAVDVLGSGICRAARVRALRLTYVQTV